MQSFKGSGINSLTMIGSPVGFAVSIASLSGWLYLWLYSRLVEIFSFPSWAG